VVELTDGATLSVSGAPIPASTQILAVAWMRWRMFVNSMFRRKPRTTRQAIGFALVILMQLIFWPIVAVMVIGPVAGSGFWAWEAISEHHPQRLQTLLAAVVVGWQFVAINGLSIAASVTKFDPSSLIRYPLRFGRYFVLRTLIGLLTASTIVGCLSLLAAAIGIGVARPSLALPALLVLAVYALMNIFLTRMIGAWLERLLANRRFRELFGLLMGLSIVSLQLLNVQRYAPRVQGAPRGWSMPLLLNGHSSAHWLPPAYAANAILHSSHPLAALAPFAALLASTALFAAIFAFRLRKQFQGEYFSDSAAMSAPGKSRQHPKRLLHESAARPSPASALPQTARLAFPPVVGACLRKEWLVFRGNTVQFVGLITPLVFIVILNRGQFALHPTLFLPAAIAYVLLGALASLYNIFGADGLGVQVYLLAPIRMRDVIVAKNISSLILTVSEAIIAWALVSFLKRAPIPLATEVSTAFWAIFVIMINVVLGTVRSVQAPHRFTPGQARQKRGTPTNRTSGIIILFVLFGSVLLQVPVVLLCRYLHQPWLAAWVFGPLAAASVAAYAFLLRNAEKLVLSHRDVLAEELCKV